MATTADLSPFWLDAFNTGDREAVARLFPADVAVQWYFQGAPYLPVGIEGIHTMLTTLHTAVADLRFVVESSIGQRSIRVWHWKAEGRHVGALPGVPPDNEPITLSGKFLVRTIDGKPVEFSARIVNPRGGPLAAKGDGFLRTRLAETVMSHSVEAFLSPQEIADILAEVEREKARLTDEQLRPGKYGKGIVRVVEAAPNERIEIAVPPRIERLLDDAFFRRLDDLRRPFPFATWPNYWLYIEYGEGQNVNHHIDGNHDGRKVAGCTLLLSSPEVGGEFFLETCGSEAIWMDGKQGLTNLPMCRNNEWFNSIPKTRWLAAQEPGTAIFYGSQAIHGTVPVKKGIAKKLLAFVYSPLGK